MRLSIPLMAFYLCGMQVVYAASLSNSALGSNPVLSPTSPQTLVTEKKQTQTNSKTNPKYYISLIIDDMGYRYQSGKRAINLPAHITYSFLPYAPHARQLANLANIKHKEIMLHIPMEATNGKRMGPGGLTTAMPKPVFKLEIEHDLSAIPYIKGVNNHMGSLLTQQFEPMTWLMEMLAAKKMYFIDSRTSAKSQALKAARQYGLRSETRDVFVDHDLSKKAMQQQLRKAIKVAKHNGSVVVIAHPFPETMQVLEKWLPDAKTQGLKFVYMSKLLNIRQQYRAQRKTQKRLTQWQRPNPLQQN